MVFGGVKWGGWIGMIWPSVSRSFTGGRIESSPFKVVSHEHLKKAHALTLEMSREASTSAPSSEAAEASDTGDPARLDASVLPPSAPAPAATAAAAAAAARDAGDGARESPAAALFKAASASAMACLLPGLEGDVSCSV